MSVGRDISSFARNHFTADKPLYPELHQLLLKTLCPSSSASDSSTTRLCTHPQKNTIKAHPGLPSTLESNVPIHQQKRIPAKSTITFQSHSQPASLRIRSFSLIKTRGEQKKKDERGTSDSWSRSPMRERPSPLLCLHLFPCLACTAYCPSRGSFSRAHVFSPSG